LLLVQAGATGRPVVNPTPSPTASCPIGLRVGFVADVAGAQSAVDVEGWRGVGNALRNVPCAQAEWIASRRPSDYLRNLQSAADHRDDLAIAGSFLLTDAVVDAARANPATHFVLVDPIVVPAALPNLEVLAFRQDQAAFLAGALAAMMTRSGVVAGVYGPQGADDRANRLGFEHGAHYVQPGVNVLGAYQPASEGAPYANPGWGAAQATSFLDQRADVIFGAGGSTGGGALQATSRAGRPCIGAGTSDDRVSAACLLTRSVKFIDRGVELAVSTATAGRWSGGVHDLGLAEHAVGLSPLTDPRITPEMRQRLQTISDQLVAGSLTTGF
jgi:basic membrane protein A